MTRTRFRLWLFAVACLLGLLLLGGAAGLAWLYLTFCGGHPHGMC